MLTWCAYCQKYITQSPPYDDFSVSHGICVECSGDQDGLPNEIPQRIRDIGIFFAELWSGARTQRPLPAREILERSAALDILQSDLLLGILQPILVKVGNEFEAGVLSVATEHEFSQAVKKLISLMNLDQNCYENVDIIIVCADGNYHSIGPYFLKALLSEQGANAQVVAPGLPLTETVEHIAEVGPRCVGISVSLQSQIPFVNELAGILNESVPLFVGGAVFQKPGSSVAALIKEPAQVVSITKLVDLLGFAAGKQSST